MVAKPKNLPSLQVIDSNAAQKSKSLPRGFPSDEFTKIEENVEVELSTPTEEDIKVEQLQIECLRLKLEYEELMAVRNELEQRKKSEYKEMEDLREEIATMQTLYHYRTYSVDSSESSSDEGCSDKDVIREEVEELNKVLADLVRENRELEVKLLKFKVSFCILTYFIFFFAGEEASIVSENPRRKICMH